MRIIVVDQIVDVSAKFSITIAVTRFHVPSNLNLETYLANFVDNHSCNR